MPRRKQKLPCKTDESVSTCKRRRTSSQVINGPDVPWSKEERERLIQGLHDDNCQFNWRALKKCVGTRDVKQVKKYFEQLKEEQKSSAGLDNNLGTRNVSPIQTATNFNSLHLESKLGIEIREMRKTLDCLRKDLNKRDQTMVRILALLERYHVPSATSSTLYCHTPSCNPGTSSPIMNRPAPLPNPQPTVITPNEQPLVQQHSSLVAVGGFEDVLINNEVYATATSVKKPSKCALMILDALVPENVLIKSTVNGKKEFMPINTNIMAAIKVEVLRLFSYRCRNQEEINEMWETVKISIGKRCQHLRQKLRHK